MTRIHAISQGLSRNVLLLLGAKLLVGLTFDGGIYSVLFNLYMLRLGHGPSFIGAVNSTGLLIFGLASIPAGYLGQRWGVKRTIQLGLQVVFLGSLLVPATEWLPSPLAEGALFAGYSLILLGLCFFFVNAIPFLMGSSRNGERSRVFSLQTAVLSVAAFTGALMGGQLPGLFADLLGSSTISPEVYRYPLLFSSLFLLPAMLLIHRAEEIDPKRAERPNPDGTESALTFPLAPVMVILMLVVVRFFQVAGVATTSTFFNVYMDTSLMIPTAQIGFLAAIARLAAVALALMVPLLARRMGHLGVVIMAGLGTSLGFLPLALIPHWGAAGLGFVTIVGMAALRYTSYTVYSMEIVAPQQRGFLAGAGEAAGGLSFALMALVGGFMIESAGFESLFLLAALLSAGGTVIYWLYFRRRYTANENLATDRVGATVS